MLSQLLEVQPRVPFFQSAPEQARARELTEQFGKQREHAILGSGPTTTRATQGAHPDYSDARLSRRYPPTQSTARRGVVRLAYPREFRSPHCPPSDTTQGP